jgi:hypothetical protein
MSQQINLDDQWMRLSPDYEWNKKNLCRGYHNNIIRVIVSYNDIRRDFKVFVFQ